MSGLLSYTSPSFATGAVTVSRSDASEVPMNNRTPPRVQIRLPGRPAAPVDRRRLLVVAGIWLLSLVLASLGGCWLSTPKGEQGQRLQAAEKRATTLQQQVTELRQKQATLEASDRISRAANTDVQATLSERDEEIASLRADVALYERLVGSTSQRKGLNTHSIEFSAETGGTWQYSAVLTQNLNRGAISQGLMRFTVEGVKNGKLATISWDELHQRSKVPGQDYSFRYFQQLTGSVILPAGFTPQRVRVSLGTGAGGTAQVFDWKQAGAPANNGE
ncbi:MAG: Cell division protein FtsL [Stenotrophomonas maltophilia]|uniref:Cell division protein FtsL n=1 Tax=Stenotrophomonas maltophilia TaxID=40324 RepID=A0A7V8FGC1_STEMA|nr:MAG: Cell division protein FtsL [Stenotrophomonas maltophilia]